jgi:hypothetical protein
MQLRLLFEYTRLLDWADAAGLSEPKDSDRFDIKLRANRPLIFAVLSEMQLRLEQLKAIKGSYKELKDMEKSFVEHLPSASVTPGKSMPQKSTAVTLNLREREPVNLSDLGKFKDVFDSPEIPIPKGKHSKGMDILVRFKNSTKAIASHPKRLVWSFKDKEEFQMQLERLKELTDFLHEILGDAKMDALLENSRETSLAIVQLYGHVQELKLLFTASGIRPREEADASDNASLFSDASTLVEQGLPRGLPTPLAGSSTSFEQLTRMKLQHSMIYAKSRAMANIRIEMDRVNDLLEDQSSGRATAKLLTEAGESSRPAEQSVKKVEKVFIEWKEYEEVNVGMSKDGITPLQGPPVDVVSRVEQLVMVLKAEDQPAEFRIPRCVGYCLDAKDTRFGFIYSLESHEQAPYVLHELFTEDSASLRSRLGIAQQLATSILLLHAVGWLHKDLRSANVVFLEKPALPELPSLRLCGFEYARPDQGDLTTTTAGDEERGSIYRHPDYEAQCQDPASARKYRKTYDLYSLGIVLIELAYWQPASAIFGGVIADAEGAGKVSSSTDTLTVRLKTSAPNASTTGAELVRNCILEDGDIRRKVHVTMGERYWKAVKVCVSAFEAFELPDNAEETDPIVSTVIQMGHQRLVVDMLRSIVV